MVHPGGRGSLTCCSKSTLPGSTCGACPVRARTGGCRGLCAPSSAEVGGNSSAAALLGAMLLAAEILEKRMCMGCLLLREAGLGLWRRLAVRAPGCVGR